MESSFMYGAPAEPAPPENAAEKKNGDMTMNSDMSLKMMIRETLTKTVRSLLRKQKQHRDLQRRGVREEPPGGARCSVLRRRRGLQGFWQRGSPGSGRGCSCRCRHPPPSPPAVGVRVAAVVLRRRRVDHVGISRGRLEQRRARGGEEVEQPTLLPLFLVVAIAVVLDVLPTYAPTPRPSALPMPTLHPRTTPRPCPLHAEPPTRKNIEGFWEPVKKDVRMTPARVL